MSTTLIVGFDSAWTAGKQGAMCAALRHRDGRCEMVLAPAATDFGAATSAVRRCIQERSPGATLVLLDQPHIVPNAKGQRPVEHLVSSSVGARLGGVQPANTSKSEMFGPDAPVWPFLRALGGPAAIADVARGGPGVHVVETYPVLALIAWGWLLPHERATGQLPKYNPERRRTFRHEHVEFVGERLAKRLRSIDGLARLAGEVEEIPTRMKGAGAGAKKALQDRLDAALCLAVGIELARGADCLVAGQDATGYMLVPYGEPLAEELRARCAATGRASEEWVRQLRRPVD